MRVLVIDDEAAICYMLKAVLATQNHDVACAQSVCEGLKTLDGALHDIVLLDWTIADLSGAKALAAIRAAAPDTKVCVVTGTSTGVVADATADNPPDAILPKPVDIQSLLSTISSLCSTAPADT